MLPINMPLTSTVPTLKNPKDFLQIHKNKEMIRPINIPGILQSSVTFPPTVEYELTPSSLKHADIYQLEPVILPINMHITPTVPSLNPRTSYTSSMYMNIDITLTISNSGTETVI